jgi:large-conductance mechanosensitive channel
MRTSKAVLVICLIVLIMPLLGMGAEGEGSGMNWGDFLKPALESALLFGAVALVFIYVFRRSMKSNPMTRRYEEHMDRVESLLTRIADNLEKKPKDGDKN